MTAFRHLKNGICYGPIPEKPSGLGYCIFVDLVQDRACYYHYDNSKWERTSFYSLRAWARTRLIRTGNDPDGYWDTLAHIVLNQQPSVLQELKVIIEELQDDL